MEKAISGLNPEAAICPLHNERFILISLGVNQNKRLLCPKCFSRKTNIPDLIHVDEVLSEAAISRLLEKHMEKRMKRIEEAGAALKAASAEIDSIFDGFIDHVNTIRTQLKEELNSKSILDAKDPNLVSLAEELNQTLEGFNSDHKLTDGPELDNYLKTFIKLENYNSSDELTEISVERIRNSAMEIANTLKQKFGTLQDSTDQLIIPSVKYLLPKIRYVYIIS